MDSVATIATMIEAAKHYNKQQREMLDAIERAHEIVYLELTDLRSKAQQAAIDHHEPADVKYYKGMADGLGDAILLLKRASRWDKAIT